MNIHSRLLARIPSLLIAALLACALGGCMTVNCNVKDACRPGAVPAPGSAAQSSEAGR